MGHIRMKYSPCKECIVFVMCKKPCDKLDAYMHSTNIVDSYCGMIVKRVLDWDDSNENMNFWFNFKSKTIRWRKK